jgi:CRP-like cAMP-binding protein
MLIVDGLIVLQVGAGDRANLELLGAGDVIGPWVGSGPEMPFTASVTTRVIADARLALLDRRFARRTAAWPEIHAALTQRLILRARRLGLQSAVNSIPRVEDRLELTLWILGCRFGRVSARGLKLGLRLTHAQLAAMVGAQRPSVTVALRQLEQDGRLSRSATDWVLAGPEPALFRSLVAQSGLVDLTV